MNLNSSHGGGYNLFPIPCGRQCLEQDFWRRSPLGTSHKCLNVTTWIPMNSVISFILDFVRCAGVRHYFPGMELARTVVVLMPWWHLFTPLQSRTTC